MLIISVALGLASTGADEHVLAGARLFREGRWAEALVEFRVAERLGSTAARGYAGATLVKLGRPEEAVEAFEGPGGPPAGRDALLDYHHAQACWNARLYTCADRLLAGVGERSGPRVAGEAARARAAIAKLLSTEPKPDSVDWYLARCEETARAGRQVLARAYCSEAKALGGRRQDRRGVAEAEAKLSRLAAGREGL
ncbi:MAG TPA: hypothetical protein VIV57_16395 [Anaeromyxobacter sp.]